jgi:pyrimidine-nucleoside phosphorylase
MPMHIDRFLEARREGRTHAPEEIRAFVEAVLSGGVTRAQTAAWLAFAFLRPLSPDETVALTRAMTDTGAVLSWEGLPGPFIDKHSTGGVGDKVSLVLAPLWAELGLRVPMISGRGLGHTGGTLDKLEAIPGFRTDLPADRLRDVLEGVGCFMNGQTGEVAPADRILYALRNETCTVASVPLITASILSKKLSEGIEALVLDVKVGSGAFMKDLPSARTLAESLVRVGKLSGVRTRALLTDMSCPLGRKVGNACEVREVVDCLRGEGPEDLRELTLSLAGHPRAREVLASGAAWPRFLRMVEAHGGDRRALETPGSMEGSVKETVVRARRKGWVWSFDALSVGMAAFRLGAGRLSADSPIHPGVGVELLRKPGEPVDEGEAVARIWHADVGLGEAISLLESACEIGEDEPLRRDMILDSLGSSIP